MWKTAFSFGVLGALLACTSAPCQTRFTPAPGNETEEAKKLVDEAHSALRAGRSATEILTDPSCLPAHEWSRFRKLIRQYTVSSHATIVTPTEPGTRMIVEGRVLDRAGQPTRGRSFMCIKRAPRAGILTARLISPPARAIADTCAYSDTCGLMRTAVMSYKRFVLADTLMPICQPTFTWRLNPLNRPAPS